MDNQLKLNEEAVTYLDSLSPADRDVHYRMLQGQPLQESLESLTARLSDASKDPRRRKESKELSAQVIERTKQQAKHQLQRFINQEIATSSGVVNTDKIEAESRRLGVQADVAREINRVMELRRHFRWGER